jgi:hypothetical protein
MDQSTLLVEIMAGAVGTGYFVYGRKQQRVIPLVCGMGLFVAPLLIDALWGQIAACAALAVLPWVWKA